jgi:hypothetical protein
MYTHFSVQREPTFMGDYLADFLHLHPTPPLASTTVPASINVKEFVRNLDFMLMKRRSVWTKINEQVNP